MISFETTHAAHGYHFDKNTRRLALPYASDLNEPFRNYHPKIIPVLILSIHAITDSRALAKMTWSDSVLSFLSGPVLIRQNTRG